MRKAYIIFIPIKVNDDPERAAVDLASGGNANNSAMDNQARFISGGAGRRLYEVFFCRVL